MSTLVLYSGQRRFQRLNNIFLNTDRCYNKCLMGRIGYEENSLMLNNEEAKIDKRENIVKSFKTCFHVVYFPRLHE